LALDVSGQYVDGRERERRAEVRPFAHPLLLFEFQVAARVASADDCVRVGHRFTKRRLWHRLVRRLWQAWPSLAPRSQFRERGYTFDPAVLDLADNTYLVGSWQSEKYFSDIEDVIRSDLEPRDKGVLEYAADYMARLHSRASRIVGVHVRRGERAYAADVLGKPDLFTSRAASAEYIQAAMSRFDGSAAFVVFSDSKADREWCRRNLKGTNLFFSEGHTDVQDFVLMSRCDHNIIANSTFSWWAAWLNPNPGKRVIAPRAWFGPRFAASVSTRDLLPAPWEVL
jgi:hypothetical protein